MLISVVIPTYNRSKQLRQRIIEILPQLDQDFELVILDNASVTPASGIIAELIPSGDSRVRVIRNISNIGLGANVCRCMENANGEWLWFVGDDDTIKPDALMLVKSCITEFVKVTGIDRCIGINMSSNLYQHSQIFDATSAEEFWGYMKDDLAFGNSVFLTSCIFRTKVCISKLCDAYNYASAAPHIAVTTSALVDGLVYRFSPVNVVEWCQPEAGQQWNRTMIAINFLNLWSIVGADDAIFRHMPTSIASFLWQPFMKGAFAMIFREELRSDAFWLCYYLRLVPYLRGKRLCSGLVLVTMLLIIVILPFSKRVFRKILGPILQKSVSSSEGLERI